MRLDFSYLPKGSSERTLLGSGEFPWAVNANLCYFCTDCGRSWGFVRAAGVRTWRIYYRSCGCSVHDALSLFEPSMFQLTPYGQPHLDCMKWEVDFARWPEGLIRHEFLRLLENLSNRVFYDSPLRDQA